jgi:hypothetical protein
MPFAPPLATLTKDQTQNPVLFILLGASNLARSFHGLKCSIERCILPRTAIFLHAMGPGRGYVSRGGILNAVYSPIINSGIFEAARNKKIKKQKVVALITDIGNDIMYNISPDKIIDSLQHILNVLDEIGTNIVITSIPVDLKNDISELHFQILRKIYFPKSSVKYSQASNNIKTINQFILKASNQKITVMNDMKRFSGIDKIHYSIFKSPLAWSHIAEKLTTPLGTNVFPKLTTTEMARSMANNITRILLTDILKMVKKTNEVF